MLVQCPACAKQLNVPDSAVGKKAKCPGCTKVFEVTTPTAVSSAPAPPKPPPPPPRHDDDEDERPRRRSRAEEDEDDDDRPRGKRRRDDDEDEEDAPRSRRRRDEDDEDDEPRGRRRDRDDDEDDDYERPRRLRASGKSGAVTAVGVVNIVLGSLATLLGLCVSVFALFFAGAAVDARGQFGQQGGAGMFAAIGRSASYLESSSY